MLYLSKSLTSNAISHWHRQHPDPSVFLLTYRSNIWYLHIAMNYVQCQSWWRHPMEPCSTLLAVCAGNSPVTGEFPTQRPVTRSFDAFFDLRLNRQLTKQCRRWWFELCLYISLVFLITYRANIDIIYRPCAMFIGINYVGKMCVRSLWVIQAEVVLTIMPNTT